MSTGVSDNFFAGEAGAIQPVGFALVLSEQWLVERVSANIAEYMPAEPEALVGTPIADLLGSETVHTLRNQLALLREPGAVARLFACNSAAGCFDFALQSEGHGVLLEGQRSSGTEHGDLVATIRTLIRRLERHEAVEPLLEEALRQVRALTGYDQVACYGADGRLIVHSSRRSDSPTESFTLPMPVVMTMVADCTADPIAMVPAAHAGPGGLLAAPGPALAALIDRSGSKAGCLVPLTVAGRPWATILATHPNARYPSFERQSATELFLQMLGLLIGLVERR